MLVGVKFYPPNQPVYVLMDSAVEKELSRAVHTIQVTAFDCGKKRGPIVKIKVTIG
jgi:hypothetical protein